MKFSFTRLLGGLLVLAALLAACTPVPAAISPAVEEPGEVQPPAPVEEPTAESEVVEEEAVTTKLGPGIVPEGAVVEITAYGAPAVGDSNQKTPIAQAVSSSVGLTGEADNLPEAALKELNNALAAESDGLYVVIYAGVQGSGGYGVSIESMKLNGGILEITWVLTPPKGPALTVLTHPYLIAHITGLKVTPDNVVFVQKK